MKLKDGKESSDKQKKSQVTADDIERVLGCKPFGVEP